MLSAPLVLKDKRRGKLAERKAKGGGFCYNPKVRFHLPLSFTLRPSPSALWRFYDLYPPFHYRVQPLIQVKYLQPIITQYFIDNKSEIWLLFLIAHSKR